MTGIPAFDYTTFIAMPQGLEDVGGPWRSPRNEEKLNYTSSTDGTITRMIVTSRSVNSSFIYADPFIVANVTLHPDIYENPRKIPFTFSYTPYWREFDERSQSVTMRSGVDLTAWSDIFSTSPYQVQLPSSTNRIAHISNISLPNWTSGLVHIKLSLYISIPTYDSFRFMIQDPHFEITAPSLSPTSTPPPPPPTAIIVGSVVGAVAFLTLTFVAGLFLWCRHHHSQRNSVTQLTEDDGSERRTQPPAYASRPVSRVSSLSAETGSFHQYNPGLMNEVNAAGLFPSTQAATNMPLPNGYPDAPQSNPRLAFTTVGDTPLVTGSYDIAKAGAGQPQTPVNATPAQSRPLPPTPFSQ